MPEDKSLFFYGGLFHLLFDRPLAEGRQVVTDLIPERSSVLDIGSGTGLLCGALAGKNCRVIGLDLSLRMLRYAQKHNRYDDVTFVHGDATDLSKFADRSFDYATLLFVLHELPRKVQVRVLSEAVRVASTIVMVDATVPLPKNAGARGIRLVEATFGRDHYPNFKAFLAGGGIMGALEAAALPVTVSHRAVFWRDCREVVVASRVP